MSTSSSVTSSRLLADNRLNHIPTATYRLQLRPELGLQAVRELLPYLHELGISDVYLSPLFRARASSTHGYDVVNHDLIDPAFGDLADFEELALAVKKLGMGILLDVIPNHMGINDSGNEWWQDLLENGQTSRYADFFDIDWNPTTLHLQHKVLLPFLGRPFADVLEQAELQVVYSQLRLQLAYGPMHFPLSPSTWPLVLRAVSEKYRESQPVTEEGDVSWDQTELESIITQLTLLPGPDQLDEAASEQRYREQRVARRRLEQLWKRSEPIRQSLEAALAEINGAPGQPRSFDRLENLIDQQWYRLAYWRVAADEINYRRFFDINDLAAIRVEVPRVFDAVHRLVGEFLERGWVTGLRIDHPDGLLDPQSYFENLHALFRQHRPADLDPAISEVYVVAEKILSGEEPLPTEWHVCGTTGYELLNALNRLLVHPEGLQRLRSGYPRLTGEELSPADILYNGKRTVLLDAMSSELQMLAMQLYRIAQQHRAARDYTLSGLRRALREVIACMTVYRTYNRPHGWDVAEADYRRVTTAVRMAKRRNPSMDWSSLDFISTVVLLQNPPHLTDEQAAERRSFSLKMQQVTGPVMAKGLEDTSFYRYFPLASVNEVGGELDTAPVSSDEMHRMMHQRATTWPHSLSATSTHDTKRGEDFRARLHVLSEIPEKWIQTVFRWQELNRPLLKADDGEELPDRNAQYLLYQTLLGTWPLDPGDQQQSYLDRILRYMEKALREGKVHTSWMNPSETYEAAVAHFVRELLVGEAGLPFREQIAELAAEIANAGFINGLSQLLLKTTLPGIPDFYQGTEYWDFNLVDPDNRRPVDFDQRRASLADLQQKFQTNPHQLLRNLAEQWPAPEIKQFVSWRAIATRRQQAQLFAAGDYLPLTVTGSLAEHVFAFCRRLEHDWLAVVVPRHVQSLPPDAHAGGPPGGILPAAWGSTQVEFPADSPGDWQNAFSNEVIQLNATAGSPSLPVASLLGALPIALLVSTANPQKTS